MPGFVFEGSAHMCLPMRLHTCLNTLIPSSQMETPADGDFLSLALLRRNVVGAGVAPVGVASAGAVVAADCAAGAPSPAVHVRYKINIYIYIYVATVAVADLLAVLQSDSRNVEWQ